MKKSIFLLLVILMISCSKKTKNDEGLLFKYIKSNNIENFEKLIQKGVNLNCKKNGISPLTKAAIKGHIDIVKLLVKNGSKVNPLDDDRAPLEGASMSHNIEIMKYLIKRGANVNYINKYGKSILMKAATEGNPNIIKLLLKNGANVNDKDKNNLAAIFYLIKEIPEGNSECFTEKFKKEYDLDFLETLKVFIDAGADVNNSESKGGTVLMWSCASRQIQPTKILIEAGAVVNKRDVRGLTALDYVIKKEFKEGEKLLRKHGAKTSKELDNEKIK